MHSALFAVFGFVGDLVLLSNHDQHIAYGAHLGGFLSGVAIAAIITTIYPDALRLRTIAPQRLHLKSTSCSRSKI